MSSYAEDLVLWQEPMPGGKHWSGVMRRGTTLRLTDVDGRANVAALFYNREFTAERYNMPDTLKAQHTAYLTAGHVCYSDMGRILCAIASDGCGWHDALGGALDTATLAARYGALAFSDARNEMRVSAVDGLLLELGKWGLGLRDLVPNVNFFSKLVAEEGGKLRFDTAHRAPGQTVDLRFEMDALVVLSTAPHALDPSTVWQPGAVLLTAWRSGTAGADDICRRHCAENERGYINTERYCL
jgi:urea carboxylase-associated protein 2